MREFFGKIIQALEDGEGVELVSVLSASGSTPRGTGAMMAVFSGGRSVGSIGGGNVEYEAQHLAVELLTFGGSALRKFRFLQGDAASLGMVCGGEVTLHFQYLSPEDQKLADAFRLSDRTGVWLVRRLKGETAVETRLLTRRDMVEPALASLLGERPILTEDGWFSIPVVRPGRVYVFGGGHVSQALTPLLASVGFRVVVCDDRPEFTDKALFPSAEETLCGPFAELVEKASVTADDYVVIMTRGHQADYEVLAAMLRSGARYLGCIGSRRKLELCRERLLAAGFTAEEYERVHAPIGLKIGAETSAEIAVAVAAEMIMVRNQNTRSAAALRHDAAFHTPVSQKYRLLG